MEKVSQSKPLASVVMCCYNSERYIRETIDSVLCQTYKNFEFIIWNDGSIDTTEEIIKSYSDSRIKYFYHENTGLGIALGLACREAVGKYIARIDADDICMPYRLELEVKFLEKNPDYVLAASSVVYINENGDILGRSFPWTWSSCQTMRQSVVHPSSMFRKDAYFKTCGYLDVRSCEDVVLWSKMIKLGKFYNFKEPLIKYRLLTTSLSHCFDAKGTYAIMLEEMRAKMKKDLVVSDDDIKLHNLIFSYAKQNNNVDKAFHYSPSIEEKIQKLLKVFIGEKFSNNMVFFLKNIYIYIHEKIIVRH